MRETIAWRDRLPRNHALLELSSHLEALHRNRTVHTVCLGSFRLGWGPYPQTNVGHVRKVLTSLGKEPLFAGNVLKVHTQKLLEERNAPIVPEAHTSLGKEPLIAGNVLQAHTQSLLQVKNASCVRKVLTSLEKEPLFAENVLQAHTQRLLEAQNVLFAHEGSFNLSVLLLCVWTVLLESTSLFQDKFHA